jgi:hypothetical protein
LEKHLLVKHGFPFGQSELLVSEKGRNVDGKWTFNRSTEGKSEAPPVKAKWDKMEE